MTNTLACYDTLLMRLCHPPDASASISCCILNHHNLFYQIQNALAFNRDMCCHLALCSQLLPFKDFIVSNSGGVIKPFLSIS